MLEIGECLKIFVIFDLYLQSPVNKYTNGLFGLK